MQVITKTSGTHLTSQKRVPSLKCYELVKVEQHVEECPSQRLVSLQVCKGEAALLCRLDHVMHLAQNVLKQDRLLRKAFHPVQLL